jgi:predicted RNA methylase
LHQSRLTNHASRALHRPGTIVDAGAHDGRLTLPLAQFPASRVVAFEPVPVAFARLQGTRAKI